MAKKAGRGAGVLYGIANLSDHFSGADISQEVAALEVTGLSDTDRKYIVGLVGGTASLPGFWVDVADSTDEEIEASLASANGEVVTVAPSGFTVGNRAKTLKARSTRYSISSPVDGVVGVTLDIQVDDGVRSGHMLHDLTAETATGNATTVDNGAATTAGGVAHLHATAVSEGTSGTLTIVVKHSTTGAFAGEETTAASFTIITGNNKVAETVAVTGTINRYVRAYWTKAGVGGTWTFAVALGRG